MIMLYACVCVHSNNNEIIFQILRNMVMIVMIANHLFDAGRESGEGDGVEPHTEQTKFSNKYTCVRVCAYNLPQILIKKQTCSFFHGEKM
jgi:hypothetical protein